MDNRIFAVIVAVVLAATVTAFVAGYTKWNTLGTNDNTIEPTTLFPTENVQTTTPQVTTEISQSPVPEETPVPTIIHQVIDNTTIQQIRDSVFTFIIQNHPEASATSPGSWKGGKQATGQLDQETYIYSNNLSTITISYPAIQEPTFTVTANFSNGTLIWLGTYQNGIITETNSMINTNSSNIP